MKSSVPPANDLPTISLDKARHELTHELVIKLYVEAVLPIGKAMALAGVSRAEFERLLKLADARRPFDEVELSRDLAWADAQ